MLDEAVAIRIVPAAVARDTLLRRQPVDSLHVTPGMAEGMAWRTSWGCFKAIVLSAAPMAAWLLVLLRFADAARPGPTASYGVLAVAALSAAGLSLYHELETAFMVLIWHVGTIALLVAVALMGNRRIFRLVNR